MTLVLALDTSAEACAVAIVEDGAALARTTRAMTRGHAEALMPMIGEAMDRAGRRLADVGLIAVTTGPGSFTGVRTGIAAARGLALGTGAPAVGVSALAAVAAAAFAPEAGGEAGGAVLCVLETRRRDYFAQLFTGAGVGEPEAASEPAVLDAAAVSRLAMARGHAPPRFAGNAVVRLASELGGLPGDGVALPAVTLPDPVLVAALGATIAARLAGTGEKGLEDTLSPLYLRPPEAKLPEAGGRLRR